MVATKTAGGGLGAEAGGSSLRGDPLVVLQWDLACVGVKVKARKKEKSWASMLPMSVVCADTGYNRR